MKIKTNSQRQKRGFILPLIGICLALPILAQAQVRSFTAELFPDRILVNAVTRVPVPGQKLPMVRGKNVAYLDTTDLVCPVAIAR